MHEVKTRATHPSPAHAGRPSARIFQRRRHAQLGRASGWMARIHDWGRGWTRAEPSVRVIHPTVRAIPSPRSTAAHSAAGRGARPRAAGRAMPAAISDSARALSAPRYSRLRCSDVAGGGRDVQGAGHTPTSSPSGGVPVAIGMNSARVSPELGAAKCRKRPSEFIRVIHSIRTGFDTHPNRSPAGALQARAQQQGQLSQVLLFPIMTGEIIGHTKYVVMCVLYHL